MRKHGQGAEPQAAPTNGHATRSAEKRASRAPGMIAIDAVYTIAEFKLRAGVGDTWIRKARRAGLRVFYTGGRAFVLGRDFIDFLERSAADEFRPADAGRAVDAAAGAIKRQRPSSARDSAAD